ncbi:uncharacterized protein DUF4892 [Tamilnaduibacter salinus]|uniref:DUF4892 domain-containing protein n=1 Tax=Tamilnaduibacter salinus TaxID=1484056 RepID=A0A2A2HYS8_9GAMM|nr:DUF4892 domain-containing protein [Tamilnaduibacter salinus]PAV24631.1 DUF4892 domain-containing protein [Tamilnaduibacter salinus]PVY78253.1 uncharacterized protein DUF4892 [Tamilnaduibacter salinus]
MPKSITDWLRISLITACALAVMPVMAAPQSDLPAYSASSLSKEQSLDEQSHLIMLSPLREIGGEIRSEKMARVPVEGYAHLYQIREEATLSAARKHYRQVLADRDARELFSCEGRGCGRSNVWANDVFSQSKLYGRDENQHYEVHAWRDEADKLNMAAIYTVTRGNLRDFLWLEHFTVEDEKALPVLDLGPKRLTGPFVIPWENGRTYRFDWTARMRDRLQRHARVDGSHVVVAIFTEADRDESLDAAFERGDSVGEAIQKLLEKLGVPPSQQIVVNNGPAISPASTGLSGNRVELTVVGPPGSAAETTEDEDQ